MNEINPKIYHAFIEAICNAWKEASDNCDTSNIVWIMQMERMVLRAGK